MSQVSQADPDPGQHPLRQWHGQRLVQQGPFLSLAAVRLATIALANSLWFGFVLSADLGWAAAASFGKNTMAHDTYQSGKPAGQMQTVTGAAHEMPIAGGARPRPSGKQKRQVAPSPGIPGGAEELARIKRLLGPPPDATTTIAPTRGPTQPEKNETE